MTTARQTYQTSVASAISTGVSTQNNNAMLNQLGVLKAGADVRAQNLAAMVYQTTIGLAKAVLRATGDKDPT